MPLNKDLPTGVLARATLAQRDLIAGDGAQVVLLVEDALFRYRNHIALSIQVEGLVQISYTSEVSTTVDVGMSLGVEELELVPANEVPITEPVVGHELAAAGAADLPQQAADAHVVGGIGSGCHGHRGQTGACLQLVDADGNLIFILSQTGEDGKEIRKAFVPEPGCLFFSADYSQIELRVMAHLSQDENMVEVFREGKDLHAATAANIYKKDIAEVTRDERTKSKRANFGIIYGITVFGSEVTRDERTKSKRANFGIIYGITVFGLAERLDIPRDEAKMLIDGYFATFPQVHDYMEKSKEVARQRGYVTTLFGRRRYLPDINSHNATVRGFAERNAINAPIQGTAADIIKVAMIKVERIVLEEMQAAFPLSVPLVADSGFGQNWLEAH